MDKVFDRFIQNAEKINETWQIVEFFENEFNRFRDEVDHYKDSISKEQDQLKNIRAEYISIQDKIKESKSKLEQLQADIERLESYHSQQNNIMHNLQNELEIKPLEIVDIFLSDGTIVPANPAKEFYAKNLLEKYLSCLIELKTLKVKLNNSDLENAKLKNELKDMKANN